MPGIDSLLSLIGRQTEPELEQFSAFEAPLTIGELNAIKDKAFVEGDDAKRGRAFEILQRREQKQVPPELSEQLINPQRSPQQRQDIRAGFRDLGEALRTQPGG